MSNEVKRYDPINSDGTCGMCIEDADYGAYVEYADYATLEAENAKLCAELERRAVPVERITIALESVQNAMGDAYNNAYQECCGRGQGQCCGEPVVAWSDADTAIMDALAPAQRELSALLAAAPSTPATVQGVNAQLLEALEEILYAEIHSPISMNNAGCIKKMQGIARTAIAAAQEGGKV